LPPVTPSKHPEVPSSGPGFVASIGLCSSVADERGAELRRDGSVDADLIEFVDLDVAMRHMANRQESGQNKARSGLLAVGGVVVVGVVLLLLFVFGVFDGSKGSVNGPDQVAQAVADVLNTVDTAKANALSCPGESPVTASQDVQQLKTYKLNATVSGEAQINGDKANGSYPLELPLQRPQH